MVGQILSNELVSSSTPLPINPKTHILVMGGSQGAKTIYTTLAQLLKEYPQLHAFEYTVILGQLNKELDQLFLPFSTVSIKTFCSQQELGQLYVAADVVITRAGTTSLAEQELFDLKMLMIPLPWTHDQLQNARRYVDNKDGILIEQDRSDFKQKLLTELLKLQGYKKTPS